MPFRGPEHNYQRNGRTIRVFTADEDRRLLELRQAGRSLKAIADELGRGKSSIQLRLTTLAAKQPRESEMA